MVLGNLSVPGHYRSSAQTFLRQCDRVRSRWPLRKRLIGRTLKCWVNASDISFRSWRPPAPCNNDAVLADFFREGHDRARLYAYTQNRYDPRVLRKFALAQTVALIDYGSGSFRCAPK